DVVQGFALHPQPRQETADLSVGGTAGHDLAHYFPHFLGGQIDMLDHPRQRVLNVHCYCPPCSRKFFNMAWPCSVRIDSGWNCTPSRGSSLWRMPMISSISPCSFSVQAVISKHSGSVSRATTRE